MAVIDCSCGSYHYIDVCEKQLSKRPKVKKFQLWWNRTGQWIFLMAPIPLIVLSAILGLLIATK